MVVWGLGVAEDWRSAVGGDGGWVDVVWEFGAVLAFGGQDLCSVGFGVFRGICVTDGCVSGVMAVTSFFAQFVIGGVVCAGVSYAVSVGWGDSVPAIVGIVSAWMGTGEAVFGIGIGDSVGINTGGNVIFQRSAEVLV